ncbi:Uncharacterised protein [Bordetella pertussis]|nr:Uncharacterised protein [Bordetella pertussis]CFP66739.1 Uncharacterised protein [Bordetella pertussis]
MLSLSKLAARRQPSDGSQATLAEAPNRPDGPVDWCSSVEASMLPRRYSRPAPLRTRDLWPSPRSA